MSGQMLFVCIGDFTSVYYGPEAEARLWAEENEHLLEPGDDYRFITEPVMRDHIKDEYHYEHIDKFIKHYEAEQALLK